MNQFSLRHTQLLYRSHQLFAFFQNFVYQYIYFIFYLLKSKRYCFHIIVKPKGQLPTTPLRYFGVTDLQYVLSKAKLCVNHVKYRIVACLGFITHQTSTHIIIYNLK